MLSSTFASIFQSHSSSKLLSHLNEPLVSTVIRKKDFFANFWTISLYTVFGTLISTFVIGYGVYFMGLLNIVNIDTSSPMEALLFGALLSSVDPMATLSIMVGIIDPIHLVLYTHYTYCTHCTHYTHCTRCTHYKHYTHDTHDTHDTHYTHYTHYTTLYTLYTLYTLHTLYTIYTIYTIGKPRNQLRPPIIFVSIWRKRIK